MFGNMRNAACLCWLLACTDASLQPTPAPEEETFDNLLEVRGQFCVQPDSTVEFPVKVLFILDQSASLQCTDSQNRRIPALSAMVDQVLAGRSTEIGIVGFSSWSRLVPFTTNRADIAEYLNPSQGLGPATDYQGSLATAVGLVEDDLIQTDAAERARTRYVVVFVSDGVPEPRCNAGCEDTDDDCTDGEDNDGDGEVDGSDGDCANIDDNTLHPDNLYGICNTDLEIPDGVYVDFDGLCPAYNQPEQILKRVSDLLELRDLYAVGGITLSTVLLFSPQDVVEGVCPGAGTMFGYDQDQARAMMRAMARAGNGIFRDANLANADDTFLQFDFRSLEAPQALSSLLARNQTTRMSVSGLASDTDEDGLIDPREAEIGTDPKNDDSDTSAADGYTDLFESYNSDVGFDPLDESVPAIHCSETTDLDGDGLRDCEETFLETDVRHPDTDGDELLDGLEFTLGTNPSRDDRLEDLDFDGIPNGAEIAGGTEPTVPDAELYRNEQVIYSIEDSGVRTIRDVERRCYDFDVREIQMAETPILGPEHGVNRVLVYGLERPAQLGGSRATVSVACFEAFYLGETHKIPESGVIDVSEEHWFDTLVDLQNSIDCLTMCPWFASTGTADIRAAMEANMPEVIPIGRFGFRRAEMEDLVDKYVASNGAVSLSRVASDVFVPIELFRPDQDCHRPWEIDRLKGLFDAILTACSVCDEGAADNACCAAN